MILDIPLMHVSLGRPAGKRSDWTLVRNVTVPVEIECTMVADVEHVATIAVGVHDGDGETFIHHRGSFWVRTNTPTERRGDHFPTKAVAAAEYDKLSLTALNRRGKYRRASDFQVELSLSRMMRDPLCAEIEREGRHKSVFYETEAEFQNAALSASSVRPSAETLEAIAGLKERSKDILLVDDVPFRRCEEPYLSLVDKRYPRIDVFWGWGAHKNPPADLPRWPLTAFDELLAWTRNRFPTATVPAAHKLLIERPERLSQWGGPAGLLGAARNMMHVMITVLPKADIPFMEAFMKLRDRLSDDLEADDLVNVIEETFSAIRHHPVMTDEHLNTIVQALPLDLQDRLSELTIEIDRSDLMAISM